MCRPNTGKGIRFQYVNSAVAPGNRSNTSVKICAGESENGTTSKNPPPFSSMGGRVEFKSNGAGSPCADRYQVVEEFSSL